MAQQSMALGMTDPSGAASTWRAYMSRNIKNIVTASSIAAEFRSVGDPISINNRYNYKMKVVTGIHGTPFDQQTDDNYWQSKQMLPNILRPLGSGIKNAAIINQGIYNINPIGGTNNFSGSSISAASGINPTNYTLVGTDDLQDRIRANRVPANDPLSAQYAAQLAPGSQLDSNNIEGDAQVNSFASEQSINRQAKSQIIDPNLIDPDTDINDPTLQSGLMSRALNHQLRNHIARLTPGRRMRNAIMAHKYDQAKNEVRSRLHFENAAAIRGNPALEAILNKRIDEANNDEILGMDDGDVKPVGEEEGEFKEEKDAEEEEGPGIPPYGGGGGGGGDDRGPDGSGGASGGTSGGYKSQKEKTGGGTSGTSESARGDPMGQLGYSKGGFVDSDHIAMKTANKKKSSSVQKVQALVAQAKAEVEQNYSSKKVDEYNDLYTKNNSGSALKSLGVMRNAQLVVKTTLELAQAKTLQVQEKGSVELREGQGFSMPGLTNVVGGGGVRPNYNDYKPSLRLQREGRSDPFSMPDAAPSSLDGGPLATFRRILSSYAGDLNSPENLMLLEMDTELRNHVHMHNATPKEQIDFLMQIFAQLQTSQKDILAKSMRTVVDMVLNNDERANFVQLILERESQIVEGTMNIGNESAVRDEIMRRDEESRLMGVETKELVNEINQVNQKREYFNLDPGRIRHRRTQKTSDYNVAAAKPKSKPLQAIADHYVKRSTDSKSLDNDTPEVKMTETGFNNNNERNIEAVRPIEPKPAGLVSGGSMTMTETMDGTVTKSISWFTNSIDNVMVVPYGSSNSTFLGGNAVHYHDFQPDVARHIEHSRSNRMLELEYVAGEKRSVESSAAGSRSRSRPDYIMGAQKREYERYETRGTKIRNVDDERGITVAAQGTAYSSHGGAVQIAAQIPDVLAKQATNLSDTVNLQPIDNSTSVNEVSRQIEDESTWLYTRTLNTFEQSFRALADNYLDPESAAEIDDEIINMRKREFETGKGIHYAVNLQSFSNAAGGMKMIRPELYANPTLQMIARRQEANAVMQLLGGFYRHTYVRVMSLKGGEADTDEVINKETQRFLQLTDRVMEQNLPFSPTEILAMVSHVGEKAAIQAMNDWSEGNRSEKDMRKTIKFPANVKVDRIDPIAGGANFSIGRDEKQQSYYLSGTAGKGNTYVTRR